MLACDITPGSLSSGFRTPHLELWDRDDNLSIADARLATSAAPLYLPIASATSDHLSDELYVDGGPHRSSTTREYGFVT